MQAVARPSAKAAAKSSSKKTSTTHTKKASAEAKPRRIVGVGSASTGEQNAKQNANKHKNAKAPTAGGAKKKAGASKPSSGKTSSKASKKMAPPVPTLERLKQIHPDAHCELDHQNAFQLLVATVLSAQTTDVNVNKATPKLFATYPDAKALAKAEPVDVEPLVSTLGFFRQKAKSIVGLSRILVERHGGEVPRSLDDLVKLPGVGRKTANVVLGVIWNTPEGVVVDTHVQRTSQRLGWTQNTDPVKIEQDLCKLLPRNEWDMTSHLLIFHGRRICFARKPNCEGCGINDVCPSAFDAELVGRKPARVRSA
ncbi:Endonuclease III [Labilithrix luteola]|uniref:Endonuclease III n=1 Tax=Labilithrix luteola TaxID=1391654 RepID=A0A0K1Q8Q0_9BACT|nr:endonuclease III [Labilithrix luteola]AKV02109.1 Endonuclease III [Labilithrix luteola]